jgi:hypothetical protein
VNISIDPQCWLVPVVAGRPLGDLGEPDVASLVAEADALKSNEVGIFLGIRS